MNPATDKWGKNESQAADCGGNARRCFWCGSPGYGCRFGKCGSRRAASGPGRRPRRTGSGWLPHWTGRSGRSGRTRWSWPRWTRRPGRTSGTPRRTRWTRRSGRTSGTPRRSRWSRRPGRTSGTPRRTGWSRPWRAWWSRRTWWPRRSLARRRPTRLLPWRPVGRRAWPLGVWCASSSGLGSTAAAARRPVELRPDQLLRLPGDAHLESPVQPVWLRLLRGLDPAVTSPPRRPLRHMARRALWG